MAQTVEAKDVQASCDSRLTECESAVEVLDKLLCQIAPAPGAESDPGVDGLFGRLHALHQRIEHCVEHAGAIVGTVGTAL